jgi:hypothetical protein
MANVKGNELASFSKTKLNPERPYSPHNPQYKDPSRVRDVLEYGWKENKNSHAFWKNTEKE